METFGTPYICAQYLCTLPPYCSSLAVNTHMTSHLHFTATGGRDTLLSLHKSLWRKWFYRWCDGRKRQALALKSWTGRGWPVMCNLVELRVAGSPRNPDEHCTGIFLCNLKLCLPYLTIAVWLCWLHNCLWSPQVLKFFFWFFLCVQNLGDRAKGNVPPDSTATTRGMREERR